MFALVTVVQTCALPISIRRLLHRKPPPSHKNQSRQLVRTWCFQRLRFGIAWPKTSAWRARRPLSTTTATPMSIGSMPWWLTTTVAVAVSAIEAVLWRGHAVTLSRIGANFRQKEGADSLAVHPLAPCRHQHRPPHLRPREHGKATRRTRG